MSARTWPRGIRGSTSSELLSVDVEDYLPPDSSATAAVVDNRYSDRVEAAATGATKKVNKAIDSGDYDKIEKAIDS